MALSCGADPSIPSHPSYTPPSPLLGLGSLPNPEGEVEFGVDSLDPSPWCGNPSASPDLGFLRRSGYEPSDTETEWQESPWHEGPLTSNRSRTPADPSRTVSPLNSSRRHSSREDAGVGSSKVPRASPIARRHSRSPYKGASVGNKECSACFNGYCQGNSWQSYRGSRRSKFQDGLQRPANFSSVVTFLISNSHSVNMDSFIAPVIVLYDVDKATENGQHLIKWVMDCYTDTCKIILCCEDEADLLEPVKSRCKVVTVDAPGVDELPFC